MNITILGAAGQIGKMLTQDLLEQTNHMIVLYARNAGKRLSAVDPSRVRLVDGTFTDERALSEAIEGADLVYLNDMNDTRGIETIVSSLKKHGVKRIIVASILGIYNEVSGPFGKWNERMVGIERIRQHAANTMIVENDQFDYTILRLTWLYNQKNNRNYRITHKGNPFEGAQVAREAVSQLIVDIIEDPGNQFMKSSIGVSEPNTNWNKPSFY